MVVSAPLISNFVASIKKALLSRFKIDIKGRCFNFKFFLVNVAFEHNAEGCQAFLLVAPFKLYSFDGCLAKNLLRG